MTDKSITKKDVDKLASLLKEAIDKGVEVSLNELSWKEIERPVSKGWIKGVKLYANSYSYRKKPKSIVDRIKTYICE